MSKRNSLKENSRSERFLKLLLAGRIHEAFFDLSAKHIPDEEVRDTFRLDDPVIYKWSIYNEFQFHLRQKIVFFVSAALSAVATGFVFGFLPFWLISLKWGTFAFYAGLGFSFLLLSLFVRQHWVALRGPAPLRYLVQNNLPFFSIPSVMMVLFVISSSGSTIRTGFGGNTQSLTQWMLFVVDSISNVVLVGFPEQLGLGLSSIQPQMWYSRIAEQILQLVIAAGVIDLVVLLYRSTFAEQTFYGTVFETAARCHALARYPGELRREGKVETISPAQAVGVQAFRRNMRESLQTLVHASEYRRRALRNGGGTAEGAIRWLYQHKPSERYSHVEKIIAWLETLKSFEETIEAPKTRDAHRRSRREKT